MQALASRVCEESFRLHRKAGKIPGSGKLVKPRHVVGMQSRRTFANGTPTQSSNPQRRILYSKSLLYTLSE